MQTDSKYIKPESADEYSPQKQSESTTDIILEDDNKIPKHIFFNDDVQQDSKKSFRNSYWRWIVLTFSCVMMMGSYFCYDNPGPIEITLEKDLSISQTQFSLLYSVYAYPNIILPIFGGILLDYIGIRLGMVIFSGIILIGQFVISIGGFTKSYWTLIGGRIIYGLGGESLSVSQSALASRWFIGNELSLAMAIQISLGNVATTINGYLLPTIYNSKHLDTLGWAFMVGVLFLAASFLSSLILFVIDLKADKIEGSQETKTAEQDKFRLKDISKFSYAFWLVCGIMFFSYASIIPYTSNLTKMMEEKFMISEDTAGILYGVPSYIAAVFCPVFGLIIDRYGYRIYFLIFSSCLMVLGHSLNLLIGQEEEESYLVIVIIIILGFAYTIFGSSIWAAVPDVIDPMLTGSAFGFAVTFQNAGLSIVPTIGSAIHDATIHIEKGWLWQIAFWDIMACTSLFFCYLLEMENRFQYEGKLNCTSRQITEEKKRPNSVFSSSITSIGLINKSEIQQSVNQLKNSSLIDCIGEKQEIINSSSEDELIQERDIKQNTHSSNNGNAIDIKQ
eukprot:403334216